MLKSFQAAALGDHRQTSHVVKMLRRTALLTAISAASILHSSLAAALGMGGITLHSALNQPLNADIELVETAGLSADDIVARLASADDFTRAGIERVFFLNDLRFTPIIHGNRGVIRVVSSKAVTEPYLNFLVQVVRPNGNLLHEYTVLLDPATSPAGAAAIRGRAQEASAQKTVESRMPVAPPSSTQDKRYTVASGDTLNSIARRVQGNGANASAARLADGIQALNPQVFSNGKGTVLRAGQNLLLPDDAVVPGPASAPAAPAPVQAKVTQLSADVQRSEEQLAQASLENQQMNKALDDLKAKVLKLQEQLTGRDKQITELQTRLSEKAETAAPVIVPAAVPVNPAPPAAVEPQEDSLLSSLLLPGAVLILLLLLALAYSVRRARHKQQLSGAGPVESPLIKPAQAHETPVYEAPATAPRAALPELSTVAQRPIVAALRSSATPDPLDGVSIYIAYGRFAEALGILRGALVKDPQRTDIRIKILELLAEQGDAAGFASEEQQALAHGVEPHTLADIRKRHPQLASAPTPAAPVIAVAPLAAEPELAQLDENAAAALNPESDDGFHLNLDDLSMDADWDLVDPFDSPKPVRGTPEVVDAPQEEDLAFSSNLTELPEVLEIQGDQFLSDFSEPEPVVQSNNDSLDDAFLDSFMDDSSEFDLLDLDETPLSKINQAQVLIDDGDFDTARTLLREVIQDADAQHQQMARDLLTSIS
ncbi:FimV/HubP family polar landmark protein [Pseudomonas sp. DWP3-1-2]|uniref:FimV/HubP family polar landmark protein n=1 Tax=Pseudomonas sp. DWP3-1-2 TaxID=2804645 RepID=UPI003CF6ECA0